MSREPRASSVEVEPGGAPPEGAPDRAELDPVARAYWRRNLSVLALLLAIWALVSLGLGILWVRPLNALSLGGFPLGFWFSQQGSIYVFIVLILVYARWMDRIEARMHRRRTGHE